MWIHDPFNDGTYICKKLDTNRQENPRIVCPSQILDLLDGQISLLRYPIRLLFSKSNVSTNFGQYKTQVSWNGIGYGLYINHFCKSIFSLFCCYNTIHNGHFHLYSKHKIKWKNTCIAPFEALLFNTVWVFAHCLGVNIEKHSLKENNDFI